LKLIRHAATKNLPSETEIKTAHAEYFLQWLSKLESKLETDPKNHLEAVTRELENIRSAWIFACKEQQIQWLNNACIALSTYLDLRGLFFEAQQLFSLACAATQTEPSSHARLLVRLAWAEFRLGLYNSTQKTLQQTHAIYLELNDMHGQAICNLEMFSRASAILQKPH
jgi:hypothetical protein